MSFIKRQLERQSEEGWRSIPGRYVCAECFSDYAVRAFIESNATKSECTYCGRTAAKPIAAELNEVMSFLSQGLSQEYEDPINSVGTIDGEYSIRPTDTIDLLDEHEVFAEDAPEELRNEIASAFSNRVWVRRDPYGIPPEDELRYTWYEFAHQVRHSARFFFHKVKVHQEHEFRPEPRTILDSIARIVDSLELVTTVEKGAMFVRARQHPIGKKIARLKDIGPPPPQLAAQSRFSPAGITMFYGAEDRETARKETVTRSKKGAITYGFFVSCRTLQLLDLSQLPPVPSLFDQIGSDRRVPLTFMHYFRREIAKPISKDGREHIEYVPTQVVSEYFRHVYRYNRRKLDGIRYESIKNPGKYCVTLFINADDCIGREKRERAVLYLAKLETEKL